LAIYAEAKALKSALERGSSLPLFTTGVICNRKGASKLAHSKAPCGREACFCFLQDEFRMLLKQYGLEWDERYVWD
jgi:hypothetical protein